MADTGRFNSGHVPVPAHSDQHVGDAATVEQHHEDHPNEERDAKPASPTAMASPMTTHSHQSMS